MFFLFLPIALSPLLLILSSCILIGGIFLLVGVMTRITTALFVIEMIDATLIVKISKVFV
jgi:uncharacterized membrane protein YphA (DoxX/SURF4 family)